MSRHPRYPDRHRDAEPTIDPYADDVGLDGTTHRHHHVRRRALRTAPALRRPRLRYGWRTPEELQAA